MDLMGLFGKFDPVTKAKKLDELLSNEETDEYLKIIMELKAAGRTVDRDEEGRHVIK